MALGGLAEIGRNMMVLEASGRLLIVDVGVLFPSADQPGVDAILPDWSYLAERWGQVDGVLLTHGHLDHIGALPYLCKHVPQVPVYGTGLTLALAEKVCAEHKVSPRVRTVGDGDRFQVGPFEVEAVAVNHSIPDALAFAVSAAGRTVVMTGDFKMDQFPLDGRLTDLVTFGRLGSEGVDLLCADSTNADVPGFVASEQDLAPAVEAVFSRASGRVVVSSFASHIHRVQMVVDTAVRHGRKVAFLGRSMVANMAIAQELGYLRVPAGSLVEASQVAGIAASKVAVICTGSQGEPLAALSRMASGEGKVPLDAGDTVLLASSMVPGNEVAVTTLIDRLAARRVNVVHKGTALVHVSGHAAAGELSYLYNVVKPRAVLPVHGEWRHMYANAGIATRTGVPADQVVVGGNGTVVDVTGDGARAVGRVRVGNVFVESASPSSPATVADRVTLSESGVVQVIVLIDAETGLCAERPDVLVRGLTHSRDDADRLVAKVRAAVDGLAATGPHPRPEVERVIVSAGRSWAQRAFRRTPIVMPAVIDA